MVTTLGAQLIRSTSMISQFFKLVEETIVGIFIPPFRWKELVKQLVFVAWESAPVVLFSVSFAAVVTIIESSFHMKLVVQNDAQPASYEMTIQ